MTQQDPHPALPLAGGGSCKDVIAARIAEAGPLGVDEYMALALSHPEHGYYMRKDPLGEDGDFTTAPEVSQVFGEMIGAWLAVQWLAMGKPKAALCELGPGRGTLMADMLRVTQNIPGFHEAVSVHLVETSPALKQKQWQALSGKHPRLEWHGAFSEVPAGPLLLAANEFFDALPVRQFVHDGEWKERMVGLNDNEQLIFVTPAKAGVLTHLLPSTIRIDKIPASAGMTIEYSEAAWAVAGQIAARVRKHGGAALIVDYGYEGGERKDTLQAVRDHKYHDPLMDPGSADLTCHVDFGLLKEAAAKEGAAVFGPAPQGIFLHRLGAAIRAAALIQANPGSRSDIAAGLERLMSPQAMGELFKVLCIAHANHPKPEGF